MTTNEKSFEELVTDFVTSLCPDLNKEERKIEEERFKEYLDVMWELYLDIYGEFDRDES